MSARDDLKLVGVVNGHDVVKLAREIKPDALDVYLSYHPGISGRGSTSPQWVVVGVFHKTDPKAHFQDYGCKTFFVNGRSHKPIALEQAKKWTEENYDVKAWETIPGLAGYVFPAETVQLIKDAIKQAKSKPLECANCGIKNVPMKPQSSPEGMYLLCDDCARLS